MSYERDRTTRRVAEPVQVYLQPGDQDRLKRLTERLDTSKSDVLRRGLEALEREVTDPSEHPALRLIGIGTSGGMSRGSRSGAGEGADDPARNHDAVPAESEERSWAGGAGGKEPGGGS